MNILLGAKYSVVEPLGVMFLSGMLKSQGHKVDVALIKDEKDLLVKLSPKHDFVGLSTYTGYHKQMFSLADYLLGTRHKVIIGGPHATYFSDECSKHSTYVVKGEGLKALANIIEGKVNSNIVFEPSLLPPELIPLPDRESIYSEYSSCKNNPIKNVMASFGCPYSCTYCYNDSYKKLYPNYAVRYREVSSIIEECLQLKAYPLKLIYFEDDCFGLNMGWLREFSTEYKSKVNLPYHCQIRPEMVTNERLDLLKSSGCQGVTLAIETANEKIRHNLLGRLSTNSQIIEACKLIKLKGLKLRTEQMLGIPQTSFEDELELLKLNSQISPDMAWVSIYSPYLGTSLGDYCIESKLYSQNNDDLSDSFFEKSSLNFSSERLFKTNNLHKIFSTCALFKNGEELAKEYLEGELNLLRWFNLTRRHLFDNNLYVT